MLSWVLAHGADLLILAVIGLACVLVLRGMVRRAREGRGGCDGNCAACRERCAGTRKPPRP